MYEQSYVIRWHIPELGPLEIIENECLPVNIDNNLIRKLEDRIDENQSRQKEIPTEHALRCRAENLEIKKNCEFKKIRREIVNLRLMYTAENGKFWCQRLILHALLHLLT